ncbi:DUF2867 domain-containing protein [Paenibacillus sp. GCM10027628]|uniref:DUF2867 domain-containing protein n=1 Tax=Paenibacillus sp. GCM10027628 TaxID=3273413 RepID=UPI003645094E
MNKFINEKALIPRDSLAIQAFSCIHYSDSYEAMLPAASTHDVESLTRLFLSSVPSWVSRLMKLRDRMVSLIGLKTSNQSDMRHISLEQGSKIGIFKIMSRAPRELLLGEDDQHLDFRVSIAVDERNGFQYVRVSTVVYFHNRLGKIYFFIVGKIHKAIVPAMLENMVRNM